jgi:hypothetical protein
VFKLKVIILIVLSLMVSSWMVIEASQDRRSGLLQTPQYQMESDVNRFGEPEDTRTVTQSYTVDDLDALDFDFIASSGDLSLYLNRNIFNIAVYDSRSEYIWFGYYPSYKTKDYTASVRQFIESGITIDYFDSATLNEARMSLTNTNGGAEMSYQIYSDGFNVSINFTKLGISFTVSVTLEDDQVHVSIPHESIVEVPYKTAAMKFAKEFKLHTILVFPYFGSENYEINGYAMIPDGSGALIRYKDAPFSSAYVKRIYGRDLGIQSEITSSGHLKEEANLSLPVFGINHGYQQAAFLAELTSGYGAAELHSYPYLYNNIDINTTFFAYKLRDRSLIRLSGGATSTIPFINKDPYPSDYEMTYSFLTDAEASYSGMATRYRTNLNLNQIIESPSSVHLDVIGLDNKPSLLGERTVKLTTYDELSSMIDELSVSIDTLLISYRSYNRGGMFKSSALDFSVSGVLGGKSDWKKLIENIQSKEGVQLSLYHNPMGTAQQKAFQSVLRRTSLDLLTAPVESSRQPRGYYLPVTGISDRLLDQEKKYQSYNIMDLSLSAVGEQSFSYQSGNRTVYREQMIEEVMLELEALANYQLGLRRPSDYAYRYIKRYFQMNHQSNMYAYMTDSIPFVSMALSGHVELFSSHLNYASNLDIMTLKLIEYGMRPSFIITHAPGHELRYTHYEYLFTTEYALWKDQIVETTNHIDQMLNAVSGAHMISHRYLEEGVVEVIYSNGKRIIINYNQTLYSTLNVSVEPMSAEVLEVNP